MKAADFNSRPFCFLLKKSNERRDQIFHIATLAFFSYKVPFSLVVNAFFDKYALPFLKRNVNTNDMGTLSSVIILVDTENHLSTSALSWIRINEGLIILLR